MVVPKDESSYGRRAMSRERGVFEIRIANPGCVGHGSRGLIQNDATVEILLRSPD